MVVKLDGIRILQGRGFWKFFPGYCPSLLGVVVKDSLSGAVNCVSVSLGEWSDYEMEHDCMCYCLSSPDVHAEGGKGGQDSTPVRTLVCQHVSCKLHDSNVALAR